MGEVKIDIPAQVNLFFGKYVIDMLYQANKNENHNHDYDDQEAPLEYPIELGKTLLSLVFLGFGFLVTTFSLALTHEVSHHHL